MEGNIQIANAEDDQEPSSWENNEGKRKLDQCRIFCGPLLQAAMKGDWEAAKAFLDKYPDCVHLPITIEKATVLHSAAAAKHANFVEEVLKWMTPGNLKLKTIDGDTALHIAAQSGEVKIAKEMVEKNNIELPLIHNYKEMIPLHVAAYKRDREMVDFLLSDSVTPFQRLTTCQRIELLLLIVSAGFYDIALKILKKDLSLATANTADGTSACGRRALEELARKAFAISSKSELSSWKKRLNCCHKWISKFGLMPACLVDKWIIYNNVLICAHDQLVEELWEMVYTVPWKSSSSEILPVHDQMTLLAEAAKVGNVEFLLIIIRSYPDLLWQLIDEKYGISLFHIAIIYRQDSVFNLMHEIGVMKEKITTYIAKGDNIILDIAEGDNLLHIAGKLAPLDRLNTVSSIKALQMQHELLWFQEIEKIVPHSYVNMKNSKNETPRDIFKKAHEDLHKKSEKWMKETAANFMLVATIIATVVFTAAFTVPGEYENLKDHDKGKPLLLNSTWFMVFFVSDAISLIFAATSVLVFLSILTSPYREEDFLRTIPLRLLLGLAVFFISIAGMVTAFSTLCFLVYYTKAAWAPIVLTALAAIPIILSVQACFRLWIEESNVLTIRTYDSLVGTYWARF